MTGRNFLAILLLLLLLAPGCRQEGTGSAAVKQAAEFTSLLKRAEEGLSGGTPANWIDSVETRYGEMITVLNELLDSGEQDPSMELAASLGFFWDLTGRAAEGKAFLDKALQQYSASPVTPSRAQALLEAGRLAFQLGDQESAWNNGRESLSVFQELNDPKGIAEARTHLARVKLRDQDFSIVEEQCREALPVFNELGDTDGQVDVLHLLAMAGEMQGQFDRADELYEQCFNIYRTTGNKFGMAIERYNQAGIALHRDRTEEAASLLKESLQLSQEVGDAAGLPYCLFKFAVIAALENKLQRAARLFGITESFLQQLEMALGPEEQQSYDQYFRQTQSGLPPKEFNAAFEEGKRMNPQQAVEYALYRQL